MITDKETLLADIRSRFAHVESCPQAGPRIFFENAGGALTLNSVVETSNHYAAIPDNQGRDNEMAHELVAVINRAKDDMRTFFNAPQGDIFVGESGTELLFRLIMNAILGAEQGGVVLGSTLEHPATRSACTRWSKVAGKPYLQVPHNNETGSVTADDFLPHLRPDIRVATILHTSPVTGMGVDVAGIAKAIRDAAPDAYIIVDGIQHASHGQIDIAGYDVDGYVISPYKVFSRHGYGVAWTSPRLNALPHDGLDGGPEGNWELGTRDTGAYATMSEVVGYFDWLGGQVSDADDRRARIEAAGAAIHAHEKRLTDAMIHGTGNLAGLADLPGVGIIGGVDNPAREGLVSITLEGMEAPDLVSALRARGIRTHTRKADHYSGNILDPLGLPSAVRVSMCHYNSLGEVSAFLAAMREIVDAS
ncbi:aminotransferase class V-fold PLP-dependent enzyme [Sulfitobacter sp. TSTF-M16]|uniref:Aminotransferase class V-fold PLP-dependent enzyme n=1 Tax=Sulfitobacter aestuariivivens TaxID=2766981 RepID=A0A927HGR1_9RHOB|nr:aminotransferase class V-fold PLP-dependent enzyme [Sulfitobacter aestuariivivens]MBD3665724.1 aminotransferase class V-fold PLP-dependent enzyme [Sulfitobacter aestuariivivens]